MLYKIAIAAVSILSLLIFGSAEGEPRGKLSRSGLYQEQCRQSFDSRISASRVRCWNAESQAIEIPGGPVEWRRPFSHTESKRSAPPDMGGPENAPSSKGNEDLQKQFEKSK